MAERRVYTVKQVNSYVKRMFEDDFVLRTIYIRGEISNLKYHSSGHIYFSLKDESGVISAVMFASNAAGLKFRLRDGMQVVAGGSVSVYERDGKFQIYVRNIEEEGAGDLYKKYEELKNRLEEMGMFSEMYKKPIPAYGIKIGVVTAKTGAVIRDIYNVSSRRNPYTRLFLYPAQVQGEGAARTIINGIRALDVMGLDCIIIGRGGGSMEDLWCFNDEELARTIFEAQTPIISAVGHETDFTIADFVADLRAPTPSAAAELAVFDYNQFLLDLDGYRNALDDAVSGCIENKKAGLALRKLTLENLSPANVLKLKKQHVEAQKLTLENCMQMSLKSSREKLKVQIATLDGLSPLTRLSQGYAFAEGKEGKPLKSVKELKTGSEFTIHMKDGIVEAEALNIKEKSYE